MTEVPGIDLRRLVACLNEHEVDFILVGGVAGLLRGTRRPTSDADLLIDNGDDNVDRFLRVCHDLRLRNRVSDPTLDEQLAERAAQRTWHRSDVQDVFWSANTDAGPVDVLPSLAVSGSRRAQFAELIERTTEMVIDNDPALVVKVARLTLLIESKQAANRPKDREALPELMRLAQRTKAVHSHDDFG